MSAHSTVGASSCERWWNCPGSVALVATLPEQAESSYAAEGTAAHELAEQCLRTGVQAIDCVGGFATNGIEWTDEMAEHVQVYLDVIWDDMLKYNLTAKDLQIEQRFHLTHIDKAAFGTNDANLRKFMDRIIVYDLKYGVGTVVEVEENKQGLYYASGAAAHGDFEEVEIVIIQPRAFHKSGPVRRWTISRADLDAFEAQLKGAINATRNPDARLVCGPWCQKTFCPALSVCPKVKEKVQNAAMTVFSEEKVAVMPDPASLTPLQMRRLLDATPLIDAWLKAVHQHAMGVAMRGEKVLGYKLIRGKEGNRKWADDEIAEATLLLKYSEEEVYVKKIKSPASFEKVIGKKLFANTAKGLVTRSEGRIQLIEDNDPREEVTIDPGAVFSDVKPSLEIQ